MKKILSLFIICLLSCCALLSACTNKDNGDIDNGISFSAQYASNCGWGYDKIYPHIITIYTENDLKDYCRENGIITVEYDANFFDGNFVVAVEMATSNGAQSYRVNKVLLENEQLIVRVSYVIPEPDVSGAAVMGEYFLFVGLSNTISIEEKNIKVQMD